MELVYLWVEDYQCLKDVEFNFGGEHIFHYDKDTNELTSEKNPQYIEGFFNVDPDSNTKISNVTGIVGENGAGKSTGLNCLLDLCGYGDVTYDYISIRLKDEQYVIYYNLSKNDQTFKICSDLEFDIIEKSLNSLLLSSNKLSENNFIYFDTLLEPIRNRKNFKFDISSTSFFYKNEKNFTKYMFEEIKKQVSLISQKRAQIENTISIPKQLNLIPIYNFNNLFHIELNQSKGYNSLAGLFEFNQKVYTSFLNEKKHQSNLEEIESFAVFNRYYILSIFIIELTKLSIDYYFELDVNWFGFSNEGNLNEYIEVNIINPIQTMDTSISFESIVNNMTEIIENTEIIKQSSFSRELYSRYKSFSKCINAIIINYKIKDVLYVNLSDSDFNTFMTEQEKLISKIDIYRPIIPFNYDWRLSTGEMNYFQLFSRLFSIKEEIEKLNDISFILDEPDNTLHPKWQRELLNELIKFLQNGLFDEDDETERNIQIIFTTNNPMMLSDLPNSNIIFLAKDKYDKIIVKDSLEDKKRTFGASLQTLYSDSFFLDDYTLSDFAKGKIDKLIERLMNDDIAYLRRDRKEIETLIHMIGEPILKNRLLKMLEDRLKTDLLSVDKEIDELRKRLDILESTKKNRRRKK